MNYLKKATSDLSPQRLEKGFYILFYLGVALYLPLTFLMSYDRDFGYTWFSNIGEQPHQSRTEPIAETRYFIHPDSFGYDGQYYAELSLHPSANDPVLKGELDNFNYRVRRILFSWTAFVFGLGQDSWVLNAYSIQNVVFWLLLAVLLLHWFPPNHWQNAIRFTASLYTIGLVQSINFALTDGPSLFLIALGIYLLDTQRGKWAIGIFALSGLGRETNILSAICVPLPQNKSVKDVLRYLGHGALCVAPLFLWLLYTYTLGTGLSSSDAGNRNFSPPFVGWFNEVVKLYHAHFEEGLSPQEKIRIFILLSLAIQAAFFILRPQVSNPWWRIGILYTVLLSVLGEAVWEGDIGAVPRVVLPITLAFNILFSRQKRFLPILLIVNSISWVGLDSIKLPDPILRVEGPRHLIFFEAEKTYSKLTFDENWYDPEQRDDKIWMWSNGNSELLYNNPTPQSVHATIEFGLRTLSNRSILINHQGENVFKEHLQAPRTKVFQLKLTLPPGSNLITFSSPQPADQIVNDARDLSFTLSNLRFRISALP